MNRPALSIDDTIEAAVARAIDRKFDELIQEVRSIRQALPPQLGTVTDAARVLRCSERTVWRRLKAGEIAAVGGHGKSPRIDLAALRPMNNDEGGNE